MKGGIQAEGKREEDFSTFSRSEILDDAEVERVKVRVSTMTVYGL